MIGSLLYLTVSKPNIIYNVCLHAHFQSEPMEDHLIVKRIFRYLKGPTNLGLCYKDKESYHMQGFCDVDYARDKLDMKSTIDC